MLDAEGWDAVAKHLADSGWQGTGASLQTLVHEAANATALRQLARFWYWGEKARVFVFGLIACTHRRQGTVEVFHSHSATRPPQVLLCFPTGSRLEALQLQIQGDDVVYVVRRYRGDWRSCRYFKLHATGCAD